jgi:hypothetical protein
MRAQPRTKVFLGLAVAFGTVLNVLCVRTASSFDAFEVFVFFWGMAPYFVLLAVPHFARSHAEVVGATVALIVPDLIGRLGFLFPSSSTAALVLLWLPFWLLLVFIPLGFFGVRLALWLWGRIHGSQGGV